MDRESSVFWSVMAVCALFIYSLVVVAGSGFTGNHEAVHMQINGFYGLKSTMEMNPLGFGGKVTLDDFNASAQGEAYREAGHYQLWNEIIGYNFQALIGVVILSMFTVALAIVLAAAIMSAKDAPPPMPKREAFAG